jgi:hypothetical protein
LKRVIEAAVLRVHPEWAGRQVVIHIGNYYLL